MIEFESPKLLIERAKENYADFTAKWRALFKIRRTFPFVETDSNTGEDVYKVRFVGDIPGNVRSAASDTLNNLRHALDQAVHSSVLVLNPQSKKLTYFPICKDAGDIDPVVKSRCPGVHPDIIRLLISFKPYFGGDDFLWALCRIAGPNKHQVVLGVDIDAVPTGGYIMLEVGFGQLGGFIRCGNKNEWELARMVPGSKLNLNYRITSYITFADGEVVKGKVVSALLDEHLRKVEGIVTAIEAETLRIKTSA